MNRKGFISISVVYSFFLVFIAIVLSILAAYSSRRYMLIEIKNDIRNVIDGKTTYSCFSKGITKLNECILDTYGGKDYVESQGTPDFSKVTQEGEYGLYATEDDLGTSYYLRGDVENNYVQFGQDDEGNDMYWRIVRINGDGSIRMIYDTTKNSTCDESNKASICIINNDYSYNYNYCLDGVCNYTNDDSFTATDNWKYNPAYIDYDVSLAKQYLDAWYENHLADYYSNIIEDSIFCNDKEFSNYDDPIASGNKLYKSYDRLIKNKTPSLKCNKYDNFTVDDNENGNGLLGYPVGIITADEVALAGGEFKTINNTYYLAYDTAYYTMTAYDNSAASALDGALDLNTYSNQWGDADLWFVQSGGILDNSDGALNIPLALRPVINLKADVKIKKGDGTVSSPYVIEEVTH